MKHWEKWFYCQQDHIRTSSFIPICLCACVCVCVRASELLPNEEVDRLNDVKFLVQQLYTTLRIEEHQLGKERELLGRLEDLNSQLRPLEKVLAMLQKFVFVEFIAYISPLGFYVTTQLFDK